jgi:hypothetical protein
MPRNTDPLTLVMQPLRPLAFTPHDLLIRRNLPLPHLRLKSRARLVGFRRLDGRPGRNAESAGRGVEERGADQWAG